MYACMYVCIYDNTCLLYMCIYIYIYIYIILGHVGRGGSQRGGQRPGARPVPLEPCGLRVSFSLSSFFARLISDTTAPVAYHSWFAGREPSPRKDD